LSPHSQIPIELPSWKNILIVKSSPRTRGWKVIKKPKRLIEIIESKSTLKKVSKKTLKPWQLNITPNSKNI